MRRGLAGPNAESAVVNLGGRRRVEADLVAMVKVTSLVPRLRARLHARDGRRRPTLAMRSRRRPVLPVTAACGRSPSIPEDRTSSSAHARHVSSTRQRAGRSSTRWIQAGDPRAAQVGCLCAGGRGRPPPARWRIAARGRSSGDGGGERRAGRGRLASSSRHSRMGKIMCQIGGAASGESSVNSREHGSNIAGSRSHDATTRRLAGDRKPWECSTSTMTFTAPRLQDFGEKSSRDVAESAIAGPSPCRRRRPHPLDERGSTFSVSTLS